MRGEKTLAKIKNDKRVVDVYSEDGNLDEDKIDWWVHLAAGYCNGEDPGRHSIHEQTLTECLRVLRLTKVCDCDDCKQALAGKGGWMGKNFKEAQ